MTIAKLHPDFGKLKETVKDSDKPENKETDADRAIKNSKKKISSASLGGSGEKKPRAFNDLTRNDAARQTTNRGFNLPDKVKNRLLQGGQEK